MKRYPKYYFTLIFSLILICQINITNAQNLAEKRKYEPVIVPAQKLSQFYGIPVNEIFLYVYDSSIGSWEMAPFQIDERTKGPDPNAPSDSVRFYFIPEEWTIENHDGVISIHDEFLFMVRDLGNEAPERSWINNDEAKTHPRLKLVVEDPENSQDKLYGYLYRSSTISEEIPAPYEFEYFPAQDSISTKYYTTRIGPYGLIEDITIKEPGGNGQDIFDTQKLRFKGLIDIIFPIEIKMTEKQLHLYEEKVITEKPIIRLIRRAKQTLDIGFISESTNFFIRAKFYPFSGSIDGGASISKEELQKLYPGVTVILEGLRQSWDFNENAKGMKFYNKYNDNILIDGIQENPIPKIDVPIREWNLISGHQGSFFTYTKFEEPKWQNVFLYYYDDKDGGQWNYDEYIFGDIETGYDNASYGDQGILFTSYGEQDITLRLDFTAYFIPEKNLTKSDGERLAYNEANPLKINSTIISDVKDKNVTSNPSEFILFQNFPNPFNSSTQISFIVPQSEKIKLQILDLNGNIVKTLGNSTFSAGNQNVIWNGYDSLGIQVASGIYFIRLESDHFVQTKKLTFLQ